MISRDRWKRIEPILDAALDLPATDVGAYLARVCAGEPDLRWEVERLILALHEESGAPRFLDLPPSALAAQILADPGRQSDAGKDLIEGDAIGPYRVLRQLGRGGMGVIYLGRDPKLDRLVALKLLPPWIVADDLATRRLTEEAKAASALDHPNIATVYGVGTTADGRPYIAMAYYEGETLERRIRRGPLRVEEALSLAIQLADALEAAHARGMVHRDVKPANVIVTPEGVAKLVDFGLAKATTADLTEPGVTPGTVAYMSPEQTQGAEVDARSDIWSLGVVLFEMLTGRRPFAGQASDSVIYGIRHDPPEPIRDVRPEVPEVLARIVHGCLAKSPASRPSDAASLARALRQIPLQRNTAEQPGHAGRRLATLVIGVTIVAAVGTIGLLWRQIRAEGPFPPFFSAVEVPFAGRLAVLPFAVSSPDSSNAYLSDGLTEELISHLSALAPLQVIAAASVPGYKGTEKSITELARELSVANVLSASVRVTGQDVHFAVSLLDATSQDELWADEYETPLVELPRVWREIALQVASSLNIRAPTAALNARRPEISEAYSEYLKGRYFLGQLDPSATRAARDHFDRSLDFDPTFAPAWSGISGAYNQLAVQGWVSAGDAAPRARRAAEEALGLDPNLSEAHAHLAAVLSWYYWDTDGAEQHFREAVTLESSSARAHRHYAVHLRNLGRFKEALREVRIARELEPLSPGGYMQEGGILYQSRRYAEAIRAFQQLLHIDPRHTPAYFHIALARTQQGLYDEALAALRKTDTASTRPDALTIRGYVLARLGRRTEARELLERLREASAASGPLHFEQAVIRVGLGEYDLALDLLDRAVEQRVFNVRLLGVEPIFDPLRGEPRYAALLEELGL